MTEELMLCCKYYDVVVNFPYSKDDFITEKLITLYQEYIFNDKYNIELIKKIDEILYKYIINKQFYYFFQNYYLNNDIILVDINDIIFINDEFEQQEIKNIKNNQWL